MVVKNSAAQPPAAAGMTGRAGTSAGGKKAPAKAAARGKAAASAAASAGEPPDVGKKAAGKKAAAGRKAAPAVKKAAETAAPGNSPADTEAAAGEAAAGKVPAKRPARKAAAGRKAAAAAGRKAAGKKDAGEPTAGRKAAGGKRAGRDGSKTGAGTVGVEKTAAGTAASGVPAARGAVDAGALAVLPGEDPWTAGEVEEARAELVSEVERLKTEIASSEAAVAGLLRDSADSGGDEVDTGAKNISRESELALAANTRDMLVQAEHALQRLEEGTYGRCEVCGNPIGKARMQAFPRATLCLDDKQRQERR